MMRRIGKCPAHPKVAENGFRDTVFSTFACARVENGWEMA